MALSLKKYAALLTAAVFCLGLTGCGSSGGSGGSGGSAGSASAMSDDWRSSGVVVGSGTITHTGEESVRVLVTVDENSAAFYQNKPEQILVGSVSFPVTISNAQGSFKGVSFDDVNKDGETDVSLSFVSASGEAISMVWTWDAKKNYVYRADLSSVPSQTGSGLSAYVGLWEYADENLWLSIHDDGIWEFLNDQDDVVHSGTLQQIGTGITLIFDGSGNRMQLDRAASGDLLDGENGGVLVPAEGIQSSVPYFVRNGLEINAAMDGSLYLLENGFGSYAAKTGNGYTAGDCYWEAFETYDETYNGIREIKIEAICYVPYSSIGKFSGEAKYSAYHQLYDYYTGKWFTRIDDYKTSTRGKNYYRHTIEWNGQSDIIEFTRSSSWESDVGEWAQVVTSHYHIFMPEGYDGLILAAEPLPDSYEGFTKFDTRHRAYAEASILDDDLLDARGCLFFRIGAE